MSIERPEPKLELAEADRRLAADPADIVATLARADHMMRGGDLRGAAAFYGAVGRLAGQGVAIEHSELLRARDAALWLDNRFREMLLEGLDQAGLSASNRHPRFQKALDIMLGRRPRDPVHDRFPQVPQSFFYPDLPLVHFADTSVYPWRETLRERTPAILAEAEALLADGATFEPYVRRTTERPQGDAHGLLENDDWSTWYLTDRGAPMPERVARCPVSHGALEELTPLCKITTRAPSIMFSLLRPHSRIPAHHGMINTRFICHLPLIVPPHCGFRVGAETREWQVGELMVFDDSVEHEAWNDSDRNRMVLIFDIWRPELSPEERHQVVTLFSIVDAG